MGLFEPNRTAEYRIKSTKEAFGLHGLRFYFVLYVELVFFHTISL
jgi:hypothetical protein